MGGEGVILDDMKCFVFFFLSFLFFSCKDFDKSDDLSVFNNENLSNNNYFFEHIKKDINSIYIFRSIFEYSSSTCTQIDEKGNVTYYVFDTKPYFYDNQRRCNSFASRKNNSTITIYNLKNKINTKLLNIENTQLLNKQHKNINRYINYSIFIPKKNIVFSIPCRFPENNYSQKERTILNWIENKVSKISLPEHLFFKTFIDRSYTHTVSKSLIQNPNYFQFIDEKLIIPIKDYSIFFHGSIYDKIGKYDS
jgi:hypothetical protein